MLIISKFKDYYDSISNIYGIDKRIVFDRTKKLQQIIPLKATNLLPRLKCNALRTFRLSNRLIELINQNKISEIFILSVCGKPFYVGVIGAYFNIITFKSHPKEYLVISDELEDLLLDELTSWGQEKLNLNTPRQYLVDLHKIANSPIIMIMSNNYMPAPKQMRQFLIDADIPNLSTIKGFAKRYSKEQVYQDISYWIANILNESPDVQPQGRPPQSDKEKILSHGLDLKRSFRHRHTKDQS